MTTEAKGRKDFYLKTVVEVGLDTFINRIKDENDITQIPIQEGFKKVIFEMLQDNPTMTIKAVDDVWYGYLDGWRDGQKALGKK